MSVWQAFIELLKRDLRLAMRRRAEIANPLLFFVMVIVLFPLGVGAEPNLLERMSAGVVMSSGSPSVKKMKYYTSRRRCSLPYCR